jgi:hypothetical protein
MIVEGDDGQIAAAQLEFGEHQISATFRAVPVAQVHLRNCLPVQFNGVTESGPSIVPSQHP